MRKEFFVTGIGTEVGKTVVSAILTETLQADYWKPVQSGDLDFGDKGRVQSWISNSKSTFHPETYRLETPASPHYSAEIDGIEIDLTAFELPSTNNHLIVEGAGGLMVPLNNSKMMIDLIEMLEIEVILVSRHYLGSINHTILSIEMLKRRNIPIKGIVFNGKATPATENIILSYTNISYLGRVDEAEDTIGAGFVSKQCKNISLV